LVIIVLNAKPERKDAAITKTINDVFFIVPRYLRKCLEAALLCLQ